MTCAVVTSDTDTSAKAGRSYWFPAATASTQLGAADAGTLDIYDNYGATSHLIDSDLGGMRRW